MQPQSCSTDANPRTMHIEPRINMAKNCNNILSSILCQAHICILSQIYNIDQNIVQDSLWCRSNMMRN